MGDNHDGYDDKDDCSGGGGSGDSGGNAGDCSGSADDYCVADNVGLATTLTLAHVCVCVGGGGE